MSHIILKDVDLYFKTKREKRIKDFLITGSNKFNKFSEDGTVHAIKKMNLEIKEGERVSIIGHNGAGKSTFLKMISGIYPPTNGTLDVSGKISSMFELATGFEMESSGWDNIYLRGLMLGETPKSIKEKIGVRFTVGEYEQTLAPYMKQDPQRQKQLDQRAMVTQVNNLAKKLNTLPNDKLSVVSKIYPEETHMTSVMPALLEGLKWLFSRCKAQQDCEF